jgi:hypothetical protein
MTTASMTTAVLSQTNIGHCYPQQHDQQLAHINLLSVASGACSES